MKQIFQAALISCLLGASAHAQTGSQIFTATTRNTVILLQWTEAAGQLKGSAQVVSVTPNPSNIGLVVDNSGLSGTRSGSDYSLVFDKAILDKGVFSAPASVVKDQLLINIPSDSGGLSTITLNRSTLPAFNEAVAKLKTYGQVESGKMKNQDAIITASQPIENAAHSINLLFADIEKATPPDLTKLEAAMRGLSAYAKRLTVADQAKNCSVVKSLLDSLADRTTSFQSAIDEVSTASGEVPSEFVRLNNVRAIYDTNLEILRRLSASDADAYTKTNAGMFKRIDAVVAKNQTSFAAAQTSIDTATEQIQKFSDLVAALGCQ